MNYSKETRYKDVIIYRRERQENLIANIRFMWQEWLDIEYRILEDEKHGKNK